MLRSHVVRCNDVFLCHCEHSLECVAIKRIRQSDTVDCFALLAMTIKSKNLQKKRAQSYGEATAQRRFGFCYL